MAANKLGRFGVPMAFLLAALTLGAESSQATVVINATRVVYPQQETEVTVKLDNNGAAPALVQAWIDDGDVSATPDEARAPFTLTPPLFRMEPKKGQNLRLFYTQEPLPQDKESLFWLNVLEVPPKDADDEKVNGLRLAFRSRIKLLYRPKGLSGDVRDAPSRVTWQFVRGPGEGYVLRAINPTPYYLTFSDVVVKSGGARWNNQDTGMVAPGSQTDFPLNDTLTVPPTGDFTVEYRFIDDYGAGVDGQYQPQKP